MTVRIAQERCNFLALSKFSSDLAPGEVECALIHDDEVMIFWVNEQHPFFVDCIVHREWRKLSNLMCKAYARQES